MLNFAMMITSVSMFGVSIGAMLMKVRERDPRAITWGAAAACWLLSAIVTVLHLFGIEFVR